MMLLTSAKLPDWLQLVGLIHDLGKMIYINGCDEDGTSINKQWSIVGDTFVVGYPLPKSLVFSEFNDLNFSQENIYENNCGLSKCLISYGHDEYLYQVLINNKHNLPKEALYIIRFHSLYAWHTENEYSNLEDEYDKSMKGWVKLFNQYDLYTKKNVHYTKQKIKSLKDYYSKIIEKYIPNTLFW